jgi:hypothetical protein
VAVSPDGRIAILDSVNRRLVILDASGTFLGAIPVGLTGPRFLAVSETALFVLDCDYDQQLASVDWNGAPLDMKPLPVLDDVVTGLFATDSGVCIEVAHDRTFLVAPVIGTAATGLGTGSGQAQAALKPLAGRPIDKSLGAVAKVSFKPGKDAQIRLFKVDKSTLRAFQTADFTSPVYGKRALEHLVSVDGDGQGGLVIGGRILGTASPAPGEASLALVHLRTGTGALSAAASDKAAPAVAGTLFLADSPFAYLGQPYIVAPDGRVIQPVADETGYSLLVYSFDETAEVAP